MRYIIHRPFPSYLVRTLAARKQLEAHPARPKDGKSLMLFPGSVYRAPAVRRLITFSLSLFSLRGSLLLLAGSLPGSYIQVIAMASASSSIYFFYIMHSSISYGWRSSYMSRAYVCVFTQYGAQHCDDLFFATSCPSYAVLYIHFSNYQKLFTPFFPPPFSFKSAAGQLFHAPYDIGAKYNFIYSNI